MDTAVLNEYVRSHWTESSHPFSPSSKQSQEQGPKEGGTGLACWPIDILLLGPVSDSANQSLIQSCTPPAAGLTTDTTYQSYKGQEMQATPTLNRSCRPRTMQHLHMAMNHTPANPIPEKSHFQQNRHQLFAYPFGDAEAALWGPIALASPVHLSNLPVWIPLLPWGVSHPCTLCPSLSPAGPDQTPSPRNLAKGMTHWPAQVMAATSVHCQECPFHSQNAPVWRMNYLLS